MKERSASRLAWSLWAVAMAFVLGALVFLTLGIDTPPPRGTFGFRGFATILSVTFGTGALIASRQPGNPIGWLFLAGALLSGFQELANQYAIYAVIEREGAMPFGEVAAWFPSWLWLPGTGLVLFVLLLFPDGHLPAPGWRWVLVAGVAGTVIASLGFAFAPGPLENFLVLVNPFGVGTRRTMSALGVGGEFLYGATIILAAISLVIRFRRSHGDERQQLKWLAFSGAFLSLSLFASFAGQLTIGGTGSVAPTPPGVAIIVIAGFASIPIAMAFAILKYRLYDIDLVINKTVVYGLLTAFITAVYVAVVIGVGTAVGAGGSAFLSAIAAAVVALAFQPVRRWAQRLADRIVYGRRATPYEVLTEFSERVGGAYAADDVLPRMAQVLALGTGADSATVWLRLGTSMRPAATWPGGAAFPPELPGDAVEVTHRGDLLGALSVAMPAPDPMNPAKERLVRDLAGQAGLVLRNVQLVEEVRESRRRIVAAQNERAKKLERDIHDGAQQQLVALAVKQRLAESLVGQDDARVRAMLAEIRTDTNDALENLRDLARGIYPPLLADKGLPAALEAQARKSPVPVTVRAGGVGRYPPEVESAVYFSVLEALQNVAKYAEASHANVRLSDEDGVLRFEVEDDGRGFDPAASRGGSGITNMRDRLDAVGGGLRLESAPDTGTTVVGHVPAIGGGTR